MRQVSTGEAHIDVWRLMYCWICCSMGAEEEGREEGKKEGAESSSLGRGDGDVRGE